MAGRRRLVAGTEAGATLEAGATPRQWSWMAGRRCPLSRVGPALIAGALLLAGCSHGARPRTVRLSGDQAVVQPAARASRAGQLRFAVAMPFSPHETYRVYLDLADILGKAVGRPVQITFRRSFAEVNDLLWSRQADLVQLCNEGYQRGHAGFGLQAIAVPRVHGSLYLPSYVIMRASSTPGRLETLAVAEPNCAPDPAGEAGSTRKVAIKSHDRAVRAVREGQVDAALVDGFAFERLADGEPALRTDLRIVSRTGPYLTPPVAVHPAMGPALRVRLARAFASLHLSAAGRAVLDELGVERFEAPPAVTEARPRRAVRAGP